MKYMVELNVEGLYDNCMSFIDDLSLMSEEERKA